MAGVPPFMPSLNSCDRTLPSGQVFFPLVPETDREPIFPPLERGLRSSFPSAGQAVVLLFYAPLDEALHRTGYNMIYRPIYGGVSPPPSRNPSFPQVEYFLVLQGPQIREDNTFNKSGLRTPPFLRLHTGRFLPCGNFF